jgi:hypothetical protein
MHGCQHVNATERRFLSVKCNDLYQSFLIWLADTLKNQRFIPYNNVTAFCSSHRHFGSRNKYRLCKVTISSFSTSEVCGVDTGSIVHKLRVSRYPVVNLKSLLGVGNQFKVVVRVELDPEIQVAGICRVVNFTADGPLFGLVSPVPKTDGLGLVGSNGNDVLVVNGKVHSTDTIGVGVEESTNRGSLETVPNNEHGIITRIRCHNPSFVFRASRGSDLVAMALEQDLIFLLVVIYNSSMRASVKNRSALFVCQEVDSLVDFLIESHYPFKVLSYNVNTLMLDLQERCCFQSVGLVLDRTHPRRRTFIHGRYPYHLSAYLN